MQELFCLFEREFVTIRYNMMDVISEIFTKFIFLIIIFLDSILFNFFKQEWYKMNVHVNKNVSLSVFFFRLILFILSNKVFLLRSFLNLLET